MKRLEFHDEGSWHERGYLPHYDAANYYQMITYRLADSLPQKILNELNLSTGSAELNSASSEYKILKRKLIEKHLDQGYGSCCLREPDAAKIVVEAWQYFDGIRYDLVAYVVMPNHVHVLIKTYASFALSKVIQSWKAFTAREIRS